MSKGSTIYKANVTLADLRSNNHQSLNLTLALHPSETPLRMLLRLLSFCHFQCEGLSFSRGLSNTEEPDIWAWDDTQHCTLWIELGSPPEKRMRQASGKADRVEIIGYQKGATEAWCKTEAKAIRKLKNTRVTLVDPDALEALEAEIGRNMTLFITIDEDQWQISTDNGYFIVPFQSWHP